jgi:integrase
MPRPSSLKPKKSNERNTSPWYISIPAKLSDTGKRQRRYFTSQELAAAEGSRIRIRKENHGIAAKLLSPADEEQAAAALRRLKEVGETRSLVEIVNDFIARQNQDESSVTLNHCWNEYVKKAEGRHKKNLERTLKRFEPIGETLVSKLTAKDIEGCLDGASDTYWNAMLREVKAVLNFGMKSKNGWLKRNPADDVDKRDHELGEVQIYSVDQIRKLMSAAVKKHPEIVPVLAFMTFAGIRPDQEDGEIVKLDWNHVLHNDRHHKRIELPGSITKTGKLRSVKIRPALHSWIQWHIKRIEEAYPRGTKKAPLSGLVSPEKGTVLRTKIREIFVEAGVDRIQDGLRHTFASYLAPIDGLNIVETELGHQGGREILNRHYRTDVRKPVANQFWAIRAPKLKN